MNKLVKLISITPDAENTMGYIARVSNPANQDNPNVAKLLEYCIKNQHWSVFETSTLSMEITTSRAIAAQILRHRSFTFMENESIKKVAFVLLRDYLTFGDMNDLLIKASEMSHDWDELKKIHPEITQFIEWLV